MTPDLPRRIADGANSQAWQERAERAAQLTQERTGIPVEPLSVLGGLWAPLEAVEAWLGIAQPASPPLLLSADREKWKDWAEQRELPEGSGE